MIEAVAVELVTLMCASRRGSAEANQPNCLSIALIEGHKGGQFMRGMSVSG